MRLEIRDSLLQLVKDNYQDIAPHFNSTRQKELWPEIKEIVRQIQDNNKILDLGCGNGRLLSALSDKKIYYLGIDNSPKLIKLAKQNYPSYDFKVHDILNLETMLDNKFDYIFCLAVFQHIPSKALRLTILKKLRNHLNASGQIIISNWNLWASPKHRPLLFKNYLLKILGRDKLDFGDIIFPWNNPRGEIVSQRYYHAFTRRELDKLIKLAGLEIVNRIINKYNYWYILK